MKSLVFLIMALGLFACVDDDMTDLQQFIETENKTVYPLNDKIPQLKKIEIIKFTQQKGRDPFSSPLTKTVAMEKVPKNCPQKNFKRKKQTLEMYSLANLMMRGSLQRNGERVALIQSPDGKVHQVKQGDYVGLNDGKVVRIIKNKVELLARFIDKEGCWSERKTQMSLLAK